MSSQSSIHCTVSFKLSSTPVKNGAFGPRLGCMAVQKAEGYDLEIESPGLIASTSRGVVPHLTRDHVEKSGSIKLVHIPFESFLEHNPPLPTLIGGDRPLQKLVGLSNEKHVILMSLRDPCDVREMPPNGKKFANAWCIRGVRKIEPERYLSFVRTCNADLAFALSDIPFTPPPFSNKRIEKSLERSVAWLTALVRPGSNAVVSPEKHHPLNLIVQMVGDVSEQARAAFAASLTEKLYGKEAEQITPYKCLDDAILGYSFDLAPLRASILAQQAQLPVPEEEEPPAIRRMVEIKALTRPRSADVLPTAITLIQASLTSLPPAKPRILTGAASPHEVLVLIRSIGIDLFDVGWAQKAADWGVALDFVFPVAESGVAEGGQVREDGTRDLGHNLYSQQYARDFTRFASCLADGASGDSERPTCPCIACSPCAASPNRLVHASVDARSNPASEPSVTFDPPHTRAYLHHLLHTHEMSAHALLAAHNLAVADYFFASVRRALTDDDEDAELRFAEQADHFHATYDGTLRIFAEAKRDWIAVDYARGKGRLAREKAKQGEESLTTKVEVEAEVDEAAII